MRIFRTNQADASVDQAAAARLMAIASRSKRGLDPLEELPVADPISAVQLWTDQLSGGPQGQEPVPTA